MKNKEKYAEQIVEIACKGGSFGFDKYAGVIVPCRSLNCTDCSFYQSVDCDKGRKEWAESEYSEYVELPVISKRDRAFLDCIGNTYKYVVRDRDGKLFVCKKVYAVNDEWFSKGCVVGSDYTYISGFDVRFPMVKVISPTVWSIKELKKLEVVEKY